MNLEDICTELETLRKQNQSQRRIARWIVAMAAIVLVPIIVGGMVGPLVDPGPNVIQADRLEAKTFIMRDQKGRERIVIKMEPELGPVLCVRDSDGEARAIMGYVEKRDSSYVTVYEKNGEGCVVIGNDAKGFYVRVDDSRGHERAKLAWSRDLDSSFVMMSDQREKERAILACSNGTSYIRLKDDEEREGVLIGTSTQGSSIAAVGPIQRKASLQCVRDGTVGLLVTDRSGITRVGAGVPVDGSSYLTIYDPKGHATSETRSIARKPSSLVDSKEGVRLVFQVEGDPDDKALHRIETVIRNRLQRLGLKKVSVTGLADTACLQVTLPRLRQGMKELVQEAISRSGRLFCAIEANTQEIASKIGPDFDTDAFISEQMKRIRDTRSTVTNPGTRPHHPEPIRLYANPANPCHPRNKDDEPVFVYYPPTSRYSVKQKRWLGPDCGAIVHAQSNKQIEGDVFENVYRSQSNWKSVVVLDLKTDVSTRDRFFEFTRENQGRKLCTVFNNELVAQPAVIMSPMRDKCIIENVGDREEFSTLINALDSGLVSREITLIREEPAGKPARESVK